MLIDIQNLEQVLQNMNTLNRSLESVIAVRLSRYLYQPRSPPVYLLARIGNLSRTNRPWGRV
jgi:hypothetical protein